MNVCYPVHLGVNHKKDTNEWLSFEATALFLHVESNRMFVNE